ncbi:Hypothetical protein, putative [Bodo saltans]|uniref:Uncharacterized protein n=1 Tax=Bodo saltans TaxID=75058 RepID=A0A0S4ISM0_BODSA|nr:Hypothetical protein, putative [Bodo saltans]|eukprot:CUF59015.1 Hypothetical protein, putative [Bodo saltans]
MVHPVLSDGYRSVSATSEHPAQPLLTHRLTNEDLVFHDEDPAPMPHQFLSTSPTPLRSPPSLEGSNVVTLVLVFSQMPLQPLQNAMRWWAASTKQAHVVGLGTHSSSNPADQLIRACQFDLLDGLQEFCFEPEDCAVRVVASTPQDRFKFTAPLFGLSSPQNSSSHGKADSNSTKKSPALRLVAKVRASSHFASSHESYAKFQAAILAYCKTTNQFAALRDVYSQLYFMTIDEEQQRGDAVTPRSRTPPPHIVFPFLDAEESTFNGIPIRNMMQPTHPQQSLPSRHSFVF